MLKVERSVIRDAVVKSLYKSAKARDTWSPAAREAAARARKMHSTGPRGTRTQAEHTTEMRHSLHAAGYKAKEGARAAAAGPNIRGPVDSHREDMHQSKGDHHVYSRSGGYHTHESHDGGKTWNKTESRNVKPK